MTARAMTAVTAIKRKGGMQIMNRRTVLAVAVLVMLGFAAVPVFVYSQSVTSGAGVTTPAGAKSCATSGMHHGSFKMTIENLEKIKEHLQSVPHDFKGHREEAVKAVEEAIKQLRICHQVSEERGEEGARHKGTGSGAGSSVGAQGKLPGTNQ